MKLARSVAASMAAEVRDGRWKVLRKLTPEEGLFLLNLKDDLEMISEMNWHASLARRLKSRPEVWVENMELDEVEGLEDVEEMADFEEEAVEHMRDMIREPMTVERMKKGEDLLRSKGVEINLLNRLQGETEVSLN